MSSPAQDTPSDEELRKLLRPDPSHEQVIDALKGFFESPMEIIKELDSYDDRNFLVKSTDGTLYLAKVHNGVESKDYHEKGKDSCISFQNDLMKRLNQHKISTSSPMTTISTKEPAYVTSLPVVSDQHSPQDLVVRLLTWVPGRTMSSLSNLPMETLVDAGRFLGKIDSKLALLDASEVKAAHRYHAWDGKNTLDLRNYTQYISDGSRRSMVESILDAFQQEIVDPKLDFPTQILQADYNDANILVDENGKISGVIDFGDSVCSWRVLDISVAMAYAMLSNYGKAHRAIGAACAMLRGYNAICSLTELERRHLLLLGVCRLACSATLGAYSYQQNPENEYLLLHSEPAWKTLDLLWGNDTERRQSIKNAVERMFDQACAPQPQELGPLYCSDLALPDPNIVDLLSSARQQDNGNTKVPASKRLKKGTQPVITFCTGNKKKLEEFKRILANESLPFELTNQKVDLPELQGHPIDIAKEKCSVAAEQVGGAVITEDTSLCFTALNGLPGPYIKWFLEDVGHEGLNNMLKFTNDKSAYAQTVVAFCPGPGKEVVVFDGRTMGKIVPARGPLDFGWDPVFEPDEGGGLTYAEMPKEGKDAISHRSRAFSQLRTYFLKEQDAVTATIA